MNGHLCFVRYMFFALIVMGVVLSLTIMISLVNRADISIDVDKNSQDDELFYDLDGRNSLHYRMKFPNHNQADPLLVKNLLSKMIPPSPKNVPYSSKGHEFEPSRGQGRVIRKLTNYKRGGFFIECGAGNGEFFSNTLLLERDLGWTGLLVEADPRHQQALLNLHRKSWLAPVCMSLNNSAYEASFDSSLYFLGKVHNSPISKEANNLSKVICFPFYTFLLALEITTVDYFSLDVEGHETEVLENIPFDKVDIKTLSVEFSKARGGLLGIKNLMERNGYTLVMEVHPDDLIFVKKNHSMTLYDTMLLL